MPHHPRCDCGLWGIPNALALHIGVTAVCLRQNNA
jgi:hypothetical protein